MDNKHENCWFKKGCTLGCCDEAICVKYENMLAMLKLSGLTPDQYNRTSYSFQPTYEDGFLYKKLMDVIQNDLVSWKENFNSLYLYSNNYLNGKTFWAEKLLLSYMALWTKYHYENSPCGYFVTAGTIKNVINRQYDDKDRFQNLCHCLESAELLVIDNVDDLFGNERYEGFLASLLDGRYQANKSVIFTSHTPPSEFYSKSSNKFLESRIITLSKLLEFKAPSWVAPEKWNKEGGNQ